MVVCSLFILVTLTTGVILGDDSFLSKFVQSDYQVKDVRVDVVYYNKDIVNTYKCVNFKPNRTTTAFNFSINYKIDVEDKILVVVESYKFASNEYRHFPMRFQVNMCKSFNANILGIAAGMKCGNMERCFFRKEVTYNFCNFVLDYTRLPPHIPTGMYKIEMSLWYLQTKVSVVNGYGEIFRQLRGTK